MKRTQLGRWVLPFVVAAALTAAARAAPTPVKSETASGLGVKATLSYTHSARGYYIRLIVVRGGERVFDRRVTQYEPQMDPPMEKQPLGDAFPGKSTITIRDLDGNGAPEILLDFWGGYANCCYWTRIYRWIAAAKTYASADHLWGVVSYRFVERAGARRPLFVSGDSRFAAAFTDFASSAFPAQVWAYRSGRLVEVTRSFPTLVGRDAARQWAVYRKTREGGGEVRDVLAAWAADECRLGKGRQALAWLRGHPAVLSGNDDVGQSGSTATYLARLPVFLKRRGYPC
jgi:hypothetical protein